MKATKIKILALVIFVSTAISSCKKYLDINTDPNNPVTSRVDLLLPVTQLYVGNAIGDRLFGQTSIWCQYYTGGPGVSLGDFDKNTMSTTDGNQAFNNMYRGMNNLAYIINKSGEPAYIGIAKIMTAYQMQLAVDLFGNVPYTEAFKGDLVDGFVISPKYDNAETVIYPAIEKLLTDGVKEFAKVDVNSLKPGTDDLIYGGDTASWTKFANSLLLKLYIRQGSTASAAKFKALYATTPSLISLPSEIAKISYPGNSIGRNPFWTSAFSSSLQIYYVGTKTTIDYLNNTADPRIKSFYNPAKTGAQIGMKPGDVENSPSTADYSRPTGAKADDPNSPPPFHIFTPTSPVILMSNWEVSFILAEAAARGWITEDDKAMYESGVTKSVTYLGGSIGDYLTNGGAYNATNLNSKIKSIAIQKWISMNGLQPVESWIETRRFDNATTPIFASTGGLFITPTQNVLGGRNFPSILFYPATEQDLNKSFPKQNTLTGKVFWDK